MVPGTVNAEAIAINKDHVGMAKFDSLQDDDFQSIRGHIRLMIGNAPKKIDARWQRHKKHEGM